MYVIQFAIKLTFEDMFPMKRNLIISRDRITYLTAPGARQGYRECSPRNVSISLALSTKRVETRKPLVSSRGAHGDLARFAGNGTSGGGFARNNINTSPRTPSTKCDTLRGYRLYHAFITQADENATFNVHMSRYVISSQ